MSAENASSNNANANNQGAAMEQKGHNSSGDTNLAIVDERALEGKIHMVRGVKVMLDFDLAEIYGYSTKAFNQQVKRNQDKFEDIDFMFQLTEAEWEILRSQFVTSSWGGTRHLPYAFTEQGVYMLMTVLKGDLATRQSKALIRLFKHMKDQLIENRQMVELSEFSKVLDRITADEGRILEVERNVSIIGKEVSGLVKQAEDLVSRSEIAQIIGALTTKEGRIGYYVGEDELLSADFVYSSIYHRATEYLWIIDNYVSKKTLVPLATVAEGVEITIFTPNRGNLLHQSDVDDFLAEHPGVRLEFRNPNRRFHDRFIIMDRSTDNEHCYFCGPSSKDAGKGVAAIVELPENDRASFYSLLVGLEASPVLELPK